MTPPVQPPTEEPRCICGGMYDAADEGDIDVRPDWLDEAPF